MKSKSPFTNSNRYTRFEAPKPSSANNKVPPHFAPAYSSKVSSSETTLRIYDQLNNAFNVLQYSNKHLEGHSLKQCNEHIERIFQRYKQREEAENLNKMAEEEENIATTEEGEEEEVGAPPPTRQSLEKEEKPAADGEQPAEAGPKEEGSPEGAKAGSPPKTAGNEFPLSDSAVLKELQEADERANRATKVIESIKEQIAEYSKKENMTEEDVIMMQQKQAELMEKMSEFEDITRRVQQLVGLVDVASSQLGDPKQTVTEGVRAQAKPSLPEETLPKVIVCGAGKPGQIPKIIVCEPTRGRDGKNPVYQQIQGQPATCCPKPKPKNQPSQNWMEPGWPGVPCAQFPQGPYPPNSPFPPGYPQGSFPPQMGGFPMAGQYPPGAGQFPPGQYPPGAGQFPPGGGAYPPGPGGFPPGGAQFPPGQGMYPPGAGQFPSNSQMGPPSQFYGYDNSGGCQPPGRPKKCDEKKQSKTDNASARSESPPRRNGPCDAGEGKQNPCDPAKLAQPQLPICKADIYKEMCLPVPAPTMKPPCPGAKKAIALGVNENQMCRTELVRSLGKCGTGDAPQYVPPQQNKCNQGDMESIVKSMEEEVRSIQKELELVQAERRGLELQKKLINCTAAGANQNSGPSPCGGSGSGGNPPCPPKDLMSGRSGMDSGQTSAVEAQLSSLREQYRKLQADYNQKVEEVSMIRVEYESAKRDTSALLNKVKEAENRIDDLLERLKIAEADKQKSVGSKEQMMEIEQQLIIAKQRYQEGQEEIEEMRTTISEQLTILEDYRNKYLSAQQTVEEQRRQIDIMEIENNRISEQVNLEIQRIKNQFQEKLQELTPLPDLLKATQIKLQETQQMRLIAERQVEQFRKEMEETKQQNSVLELELENIKKDAISNNKMQSNLQTSVTFGEKKLEEIKSENNKLRQTVARLEEIALNNEKRFDEKTHEALQLATQLDTLREESARQVSRTKDRCEVVRKSLQSQISQLECLLAQSRASAVTAQKDRDDIRMRMQAQINSLNENFDQAQLRIRGLQSHVNYLKNSYTNIFSSDNPITLENS